MKLLFALAAAALCCNPLTAVAAKPKPAAPTPAPVPAVAPEAPRERAPGFWERAWKSTKKGADSVWSGTKKVGKTATSPFRRKEKPSDSEQSGWRMLSMTMTLDPMAVKLPDNKSIRTTVTVVNTGKTATQLDFPTSQRIEVVLKNDAGKVLSKWSEDQKIDAEQAFVVINPEERLEYIATISTREMVAGQTYLIEAYFPSFDELRASRTIVPTK